MGTQVGAVLKLEAHVCVLILLEQLSIQIAKSSGSLYEKKKVPEVDNEFI
jgi:hypothetical protein